MRCKQFIFVSLAGVVLAASLAGCGGAAPVSSAAASSVAASSVVVSSAAAEAALPDGVYTADFETDSSMFHTSEACNGKGTLTVENGVMTNFVMNDKCAAGTGRFLEMMARTLGLSLEDMSKKGLEWKENIVISSMCTVFAESEVVSLVAQNKNVADIIHGLNVSVASKVGALAARLGKNNPGEYMMTGGVAKNKGITNALEEKLGAKLYICDEAQLCGALGAALFAYEKCKGSAEETR